MENLTESETLLELVNVSARHGNRTVLRNINFSLTRGLILTVMGPNGAGKSTLARIVLGLHRDIRGIIRRSAPCVIGYVPQKFHVDASLPLTVADFLRLRTRSVSNGKGEDNHHPHWDALGIPSLANYQLSDLSGGETQRVLLARAFARAPDLLVLDEPAQGVDITGQAELYQLIRDYRDAYHCAVLMISHDLHLVMSATDQVICLNGHICCQGHPETMPGDPAFVQMFGPEIARTLAIYPHHHDHHHHADGSIAPGPSCDDHV